MAIPKKGSRKIVVEGVEYRWNVRRQPTQSQDEYGNARLTFSVEIYSDEPGATLVVELPQAHPSAAVIIKYEPAPALPADVAHYIQQALAQGWKPTEPGKSFVVEAWHSDVKAKNVD